MKTYRKIIDNKEVVKLQKQIVIINEDNTKTYNPSEEMILADGWEEFILQEEILTDEEILRNTINNKIDSILNYDSSDEINIFKINNMDMWLDKATRTGLMLRFQAEQSEGQINTTLWYDSISITLSVGLAIQMLYKLELYASKCYDNTQLHISTIKTMTNIDDINNYNYKTGYPNILEFKI